MNCPSATPFSRPITLTLTFSCLEAWLPCPEWPSCFPAVSNPVPRSHRDYCSQVHNGDIALCLYSDDGSLIARGAPSVRMLWVMITNPIQKGYNSAEGVLLALIGKCRSRVASWLAEPAVQPCPGDLVQGYGSFLPPIAATLSSHYSPHGAKMAAVAPAVCHIKRQNEPLFQNSCSGYIFLYNKSLQNLVTESCILVTNLRSGLSKNEFVVVPCGISWSRSAGVWRIHFKMARSHG